MANPVSNAYKYSDVTNEIRQTLYQGSLEKQFDNWLIGRPLFDDKTGIFPDGDTLQVTLTSDRTTYDYTENGQVVYDGMDTTRAPLTVGAYKADAFYMTDKAKQDAWQSEAFFQENVHKSGIAMATDLETACLAIANSGQTLGANNAIGGVPHRFKGGGTGGAITMDDIMFIKFAFDKALVPPENRMLIVPPEAEYSLNKLLNITEVTGSNFNFDVQGLVQTGFGDKLNIVRNIAGINIMVSHNLPDVTAESLSLSDGTGTGAITGKTCVAMSMASDTAMPFMGVIRQRPETEFFRNTNFKRDEWSATCRYGFAIKRPESLISLAIPV